MSKGQGGGSARGVAVWLEGWRWTEGASRAAGSLHFVCFLIFLLLSMTRVFIPSFLR